MQQEDCIFCQIGQGEKPAEVVYEDENVLAFLDIRPVVDGHLVVIPKTHVDEFWELEQDSYQHLMSVVRALSEGIKATYQPPRVGLIVYGLHVAHAHIHLFPNFGQQMSMAQKENYPKEKLTTEAEKLRAALG